MARLLKDKKIIIFKEFTRVDEIGNSRTKAYKPIHNGKLWAYTRQLSMNEKFNYGADRVEIEQLFIVNYRNDVKVGMYILYKDNYYRITSIDNYEGYKDDLKLYTSKAGLGKSVKKELIQENNN